MGCGSSQKSTTSTVSEAQRLRNKPAASQGQKHPPSAVRYKLDPEVLEGFAKVLRKGAEPLKSALPITASEEPQKLVKVEYQAPNVSNPFGDLLKGEQAKAEQTQLEEHLHSPEPPRPHSTSSNEDNASETQARQAAPRDQEQGDADQVSARKRQKEEEKTAGRKGELIDKQTEAKSTLSKHQS